MNPLCIADHEPFTINKEVTMRNKVMIYGLFIAIMLLPAMAMAAGNVSVSIKTEKQEVVVKNGKKLNQIVPATKFAPGDTIIYTITYTNKGTEPAVNAVVVDPVPKGTSYIGDSATGAGAELTFSIDGGKTFKKPSELFHQVTVAGKKEQKLASSDMYTDIRWTIPQIPAGGSGKVIFKVRVK
jgi:uncharacterized repeat protein (TIGR01451 family)